MQIGTNCQQKKHIWLLSGTGEGPFLASLLIKQGCEVTVSIVSFQASIPYLDIPVKDILIGPLDGLEGIKKIIKNARLQNNAFDCVVDATHPFATRITSNLNLACQELEQFRIRFERPFELGSRANLIQDFQDLEVFDLKGQRILFAIGARHLREAVFSAQKAGSEVFARILANPDSLRNALKSKIPQHHLALLNPKKTDLDFSFEAALCRRWNISGVVCRQSGGITERLWREITNKYKLNLWMLSRPMPCSNDNSVRTVDELLQSLSLITFSQNEHEKLF